MSTCQILYVYVFIVIILLHGRAAPSVAQDDGCCDTERVVVAVPNGTEPPAPGSVTAAERALQKEYPSLVMVTSTMAVHVCSGTLITPEWVLTSAHCFFSGKNRLDKFQVHAGVVSYQEIERNKTTNSYQTRTVELANTYIHPAYVCCNKLPNDFGLLKVSPKFKLTDSVGTTNLAGKPLEKERTICSVAGFQKALMTSSYIDFRIRAVKIGVHKECPCGSKRRKLLGRKRYNRGEARRRGPATSIITSGLAVPKRRDHFLCHFYMKKFRNLADGEFGAAVRFDDRVYGVFSSVMPESYRKACKEEMLSRDRTLTEATSADLTNVFSDTCRYVTWINNHTKSLSLKDIDSECGSRVGLLEPSATVAVLPVVFVLASLLRQ